MFDDPGWFSMHPKMIKRSRRDHHKDTGHNTYNSMVRPKYHQSRGTFESTESANETLSNILVTPS